MHELKHKRPSPGLPNGWYAVAFARDLVRGDVKRARYFDQEMVIFRTRSGQVKVLDAHCPHLGASLAEGGRVIGEGIQCPFHGWTYDGTGQCVHIPYCDKIPRKARVRAWETLERNHMIFVWHHTEGLPPQWELPELSEFDDPNWTEPRTFEIEVPVHMQEMAENNCDPVHFMFVHHMEKSPDSQISYGEDGRFMRMNDQHEKVTPVGTFTIDLERDAWGLGLVSVRMKGLPGSGLLMFSSTTPIDEENTHSRWLFTVTEGAPEIIGEEFIQGLSQGVEDDLRIWSNKVYRPHPVLCEADRYLAEFRRWARQFYTPSSASQTQPSA